MKKRIENYIAEWEKKGYSKGIPDEAPVRLSQLNKVPSYKKICLAILNNDHTLKSLGFIAKKSKYYHILKRIEIDARDTKELKQLKLL